MEYLELFEPSAKTSEIQAFLVDSGPVPMATRAPRKLRDSAKEAASLSGITFAPFVKQAMIGNLTRKDQPDG